jgi:4-hydroxy-tetrahydrodipicolinate synthase
VITSNDVRGVIAAIPTPFEHNESLDIEGLKAVTRYVVTSGVQGIMTTGGTGEFPSLTREEKREVIRTVAAEVNGKVPVIAGTAACSTRETIALSLDARENGADAVIVTPPYYFRLSQDSLYTHYCELVDAIRFPVVVYNNPIYTGNNLSPELIGRLADIDLVIGLKQSNSDLGKLVEVIRIARGRISICTGIDSQFYAVLCVGGDGVFSTSAAVVPREMESIYTKFVEKDYASAQKMHWKVQGLNRYLEYDPGYVSPCKEALNLLGIRVGKVRRPLPDVTESEREGIRSALSELGYEVPAAAWEAPPSWEMPNPCN